MKYVNANDILPEELLSGIQKYYQGGYLYIPKEVHRKSKQQTDYKIELGKRNQYIYLKHLEGRTNRQLVSIYHLSESSIRRIISKERARYQKMKENIEQIISLWGIEGRQISQIYPTAWEVSTLAEINHSYVVKIYDNKEQLERNIKILTILAKCSIPVAEVIPARTGEQYVKHENNYFLMSKKLPGSNVTDIKDLAMTFKMGRAIAQLHNAFIECEKTIDFWDNSLLKEMKGWVLETLTKNDWKIIDKEEYSKTVKSLEQVYDHLPNQLIHRDVHFGNFLFFEGSLSGYIDFDLSQRNIRIFDICYFLTGLLAEENDEAFTPNEWMEHVKSVITGYESINPLSAAEKEAIPCVMECIEILFAAYFISINDTKHAIDACHVLHFIKSCEFPY